ncbi:MAG TPA: phosphoglucosamine mutase, partial [Alphaproteobacteria bacterium]|nr:phosphoglucosamine mutase [Alphaproteobacteria bacterium]
EARIRANDGDGLAEPALLGRAQRLDDALGRYIEFVKATFPKGVTLDGLKIVIDCAHGAAYRVALLVLRELGAEVVALGVEPDGFNINLKCGSTHPAAMQEAVRKHRAHLGIALDGDADRVVMADEAGALLDGDQLMALIATSWKRAGRLTGGAIVATVMSNLGLERFLEGSGIGLVRTNVGDRYVVEKMRESGINVGGEQSGHIILSDHATTGDGLIAALQVLAACVEAKKPVSRVARLFTPLPQLLKNVAGEPAALEAQSVRRAVGEAERALGKSGRILVRPSGTEPLLRVMAEGDDRESVAAAVDRVIAAIAAAQA